MRLRLSGIPTAYFLLLASSICIASPCNEGEECYINKRTEFHENKRLVGYSFLNITNSKDNASHCQMDCIVHCSCVSVNIKKTESDGEECELNFEGIEEDESKLTEAEGYHYYELEKVSIKQCPDTKSCDNGCCHTDPCFNGGVCTDLCHHPKYRFNCTCGTGYYGRLCNEGFGLNMTGSINDYVMMDVDQSQTFNDLTLSLRMKTQHRKMLHTLFSYTASTGRDELVLEYRQNGDNPYFRAVLHENRVRTNTTLNDGAWHHLLFTLKDSKQITVHIDGEIKIASNINGITLPRGGKVVFGHDQDGFGIGLQEEDAYIGLLSDVNVWDKAMPLQDIKYPPSKCNFRIQGNVIAWGNQVLDGIKGNVKKTRLYPC